jgi:two-component sensor histidine kinase
MHYLERLQSDCHRLQTTVNDILDLSQIESDKLVLARKTVPLRSVIGAGAETLRIQAEAKHIKLYFDFGNEELFVNCDHQKMQRVITNVIGNAVKFTPEDGSITVELLVDPDDSKTALIKVSDTGMGIPPDLLPKLTQRYFRVGEQVRGSGLGLSISREIVDLHDGSISFASPVPYSDCGTEVSIRLPRAESPLAVLLTGDDSLQDLLEKRICSSGYRLEAHDSARKVILAFREKKASALIIDRSLKDVNIQDLVLYFRDAPETKRVPIVLIDTQPLSPVEIQLYRKLFVFSVLLPLSGRMLENTLASAVMGDQR